MKILIVNVLHVVDGSLNKLSWKKKTFQKQFSDTAVR